MIIWLQILRVNFLNLSARWNDIMANLVLVKIARMKTKATFSRSVRVILTRSLQMQLFSRNRCHRGSSEEPIAERQARPDWCLPLEERKQLSIRRTLSRRGTDKSVASWWILNTNCPCDGDVWICETKDSFTLSPTSVFENGTEVIVVTVTC